MTVWMKWDSSVDAAFKARYLEVTGEGIQNTDGPALIGSSRITPEQQAVLSSEFGANISFQQTPTLNSE